MMIQYIIVLLIVAWATWMMIRNLVGFFRPTIEGSGCSGCSGCALKEVGPKQPHIMHKTGKQSVNRFNFTKNQE